MFDEKKYYQEKLKNLNSILKDLDIKITEENFYKIGKNSRRKITLQIDNENRLGFFKEKSKEIEEISEYDLAEKEISDLILPLRNFLKTFEKSLISQIIVTKFDNSIDVIFSIKREFNFTQSHKIIELARSLNINVSYKIKNHVEPIIILKTNQIIYPNFKIDLDGEIFIQATKKGLDKILSVILEFTKNNFEKKINIADIYSGFGAYSFAIADYAKEISAFEGSQKMIDLINKNAAKNSLGRIKGITRDLILYPLNAPELKNFDLVIINPPRNGAGPQIEQVVKSNLKNLIYVSCNPESYVRDAKILLKNNFKIARIEAIDQFYSTPHLELVCVFER